LAGKFCKNKQESHWIIVWAGKSCKNKQESHWIVVWAGKSCKNKPESHWIVVWAGKSYKNKQEYHIGLSYGQGNPVKVNKNISLDCRMDKEIL
jgi:hypothetical protein